MILPSPIDRSKNGAFHASQYLKSQTSVLHAEIERQIDWDGVFLSRHSYAHALRCLRSLVSPADTVVDSLLAGESAHFVGRRTAAWIDRDLSSLDVESTSSPQASDDTSSITSPHKNLDWVEDPAAAAGVLYVLEGSSLGGVYLARMAEERLGLTHLEGASYFYGYGPEAGRRWQETRSWLDLFLDTPGKANLALEAATTMFTLYGNVLGLGDNDDSRSEF